MRNAATVGGSGNRVKVAFEVHAAFLITAFLTSGESRRKPHLGAWLAGCYGSAATAEATEMHRHPIRFCRAFFEECGHRDKHLVSQA